MEQAAKGLRPADKVLDSVRGALELAGMEGHIPSVREYLEAFPKLAREQSERNRRRSFKVFLEFLGADADKRLDKINHTRCRDFVRWALGQVSRKTVQQYYTYVSGAFKRAVEVDDLLNKNPMAGVSVTTDKDSGIVNDPNLWCEEHGDPEYIINLLLRVITVSLETVKIVNSLSPMEIID